MTPKCNAALVEAIFELMFETLWLAPYDRRRRNTAFGEYEISVRHTARMLSAADLAVAGAEQRRQMSQAVHTLAESIGRLSQAGVFPPDRCEAAMNAVEEIMEAVDEKVVIP